jgi:hypothetical protein
MTMYGDEVLSKRVFVEFVHDDGARRPYAGIVQRKIEWTELDNAGNLICKVKHEVRFEEIDDVLVLDLKEKEGANQLMWWYDGNDVDVASTPTSRSSQNGHGSIQLKWPREVDPRQITDRSDASAGFDSSEDSGINSTDDSSFEDSSRASQDDTSESSSDEPTDDSGCDSSEASSVHPRIVHVRRRKKPRTRAKPGQKERRSSWRRAMEEKLPEWLQGMCMIGVDTTTTMPPTS